jgi:hypothetical protein
MEASWCPSIALYLGAKVTAAGPPVREAMTFVLIQPYASSQNSAPYVLVE